MDVRLAERFRPGGAAGGFLLVTLCQGALRVPRRTSRCRPALCDVRDSGAMLTSMLAVAWGMLRRATEPQWLRRAAAQAQTGQG